VETSVWVVSVSVFYDLLRAMVVSGESAQGRQDKMQGNQIPP